MPPFFTVYKLWFQVKSFFHCRWPLRSIVQKFEDIWRLNSGLVAIFVERCKNAACAIKLTNHKHAGLMRNRINILKFTEKLFARNLMNCCARMKRSSEEYFLSSSGFCKSCWFTELKVNHALTIIQLRKVAPYFVMPCFFFHSPCSEMVVKCLASRVLMNDGFQLAIRNIRFHEMNSHCFCALSTKMNHELLCCSPLVLLILPMSYYLAVVAYSQLEKKGLHWWKTLFASPWHLLLPGELYKR